MTRIPWSWWEGEHLRWRRTNLKSDFILFIIKPTLFGVINSAHAFLCAGSTVTAKFVAQLTLDDSA